MNPLQVCGVQAGSGVERHVAGTTGWSSEGAWEEAAALANAFFPNLRIVLTQRDSVQQAMGFTDILNFSWDSGFLCPEYHFIAHFSS